MKYMRASIAIRSLGRSAQCDTAEQVSTPLMPLSDGTALNSRTRRLFSNRSPIVLLTSDELFFPVSFLADRRWQDAGPLTRPSRISHVQLLLIVSNICATVAGPPASQPGREYGTTTAGEEELQ